MREGEGCPPIFVLMKIFSDFNSIGIGFSVYSPLYIKETL